MTRSGAVAWLLLLLLLAACAPTATPEPVADPRAPPEIEFAGIVTDVRTYADHYEFTDAAGTVYAIEIGRYRELGEHGCCGPLLVLGTDADGPFLASFVTQGGLPDDCYVENDPGIDRGSHIEIFGVLWRKTPDFESGMPFGTRYLPGTRFCFDERGRVAEIVPP